MSDSFESAAYAAVTPPDTYLNSSVVNGGKSDTKAPVMVDIAEVRAVVVDILGELTAASIITALVYQDTKLSHMIAGPSLKLTNFVEEVERRG